MGFQVLPALSLPLLVQDALVVVGAGVALLASLVVINFGVLLPGLLTSLGGLQPDLRGAYPESGPRAARVISASAPPRETQQRARLSSQPAARPHIWRHLLVGMALYTTPQHAVPTINTST